MASFWSFVSTIVFSVQFFAPQKNPRQKHDKGNALYLLAHTLPSFFLLCLSYF